MSVHVIVGLTTSVTLVCIDVLFIFQIIFVAQVGTSYKGDISLDDIILSPGCVLNKKSLPGKEIVFRGGVLLQRFGIFQYFSIRISD